MACQWKYCLLKLLIFFCIFASCFASRCSGNQLPCGDGMRCFDTSQKCDGQFACSNGRDERNCSDEQKKNHMFGTHNKKLADNFAWLVTPVIFGLGCLYAVFKCFKEGLCTICKMRRQNGSVSIRNTNTNGRNCFALDRWSFYSLARIPTNNLADRSPFYSSSQRHLMVISNRNFSITVNEDGSGCVTGEACSDEPPAYDEAVSCPNGISNTGFQANFKEDPDLPSYTEATSMQNSYPHAGEQIQPFCNTESQV